MDTLLICLLIGFLILVHEAGHFVAARVVGIPVERFSVGFGPRVGSLRSGGTEYRFSLIPLGGYVLPAIRDEADFFRIPALRRILFALGGPLANVLLAFAGFAVLGLLESGWSLHGLVAGPAVRTATLFGRILASIPEIVASPDQLSGIVGIVAQGSQLVGEGVGRTLEIGILLSLNLAVLNLLPIPALDGGKILLFLLEKVHPRLAGLHVPLSIAGWVMILGLMAYVTVMDVGRLLA